MRLIEMGLVLVGLFIAGSALADSAPKQNGIDAECVSKVDAFARNLVKDGKIKSDQSGAVLQLYRPCCQGQSPGFAACVSGKEKLVADCGAMGFVPKHLANTSGQASCYNFINDFDSFSENLVVSSTAKSAACTNSARGEFPNSCLKEFASSMNPLRGFTGGSKGEISCWSELAVQTKNMAGMFVQLVWNYKQFFGNTVNVAKEAYARYSESVKQASKDEAHKLATTFEDEMMRAKEGHAVEDSWSALQHMYRWANGDPNKDYGASEYDLVKVLYHLAAQAAGCTKWSGTPFHSECLETDSTWDCADCAKRTSVVCGMIPIAFGGEITAVMKALGAGAAGAGLIAALGDEKAVQVMSFASKVMNNGAAKAAGSALGSVVMPGLVACGPSQMLAFMLLGNVGGMTLENLGGEKILTAANNKAFDAGVSAVEAAHEAVSPEGLSSQTFAKLRAARAIGESAKTLGKSLSPTYLAAYAAATGRNPTDAEKKKIEKNIESDVKAYLKGKNIKASDAPEVAEAMWKLKEKFLEKSVLGQWREASKETLVKADADVALAKGKLDQSLSDYYAKMGNKKLAADYASKVSSDKQNSIQMIKKVVGQGFAPTAEQYEALLRHEAPSSENIDYASAATSLIRDAKLNPMQNGQYQSALYRLITDPALSEVNRSNGASSSVARRAGRALAALSIKDDEAGSPNHVNMVRDFADPNVSMAAKNGMADTLRFQDRVKALVVFSDIKKELNQEISDGKITSEQQQKLEARIEDAQRMNDRINSVLDQKGLELSEEDKAKIRNELDAAVDKGTEPEKAEEALKEAAKDCGSQKADASDVIELNDGMVIRFASNNVKPEWACESD